MPEFAQGEAKTALVPVTVSPAGLGCEAEIFLGPNDMTKVATSGRIPFTSTGVRQNVSLPIAMPAAEGTYHVFIDVYAEGYLIAAYQAIEDVVIAPPAPIIDSDSLSVFSVEGIPFESVDMEYAVTSADFAQVLAGYSCATWQNPNCIANPGAVAQAVGDAIYADHATLVQALISAGITSALAPTIADRWNFDYARQETIVATLSEPIPMDALRGITSLSFANKVPLYKAQACRFNLLYQPQFFPPMPPPAFFGYMKLPAVGVISSIAIAWCYGSGYYYPGIYDGLLSYHVIDEVGQYTQRLTFRIRNLAKVSKKGTVLA